LPVELREQPGNHNTAVGQRRQVPHNPECVFDSRAGIERLIEGAVGLQPRQAGARGRFDRAELAADEEAPVLENPHHLDCARPLSLHARREVLIETPLGADPGRTVPRLAGDACEIACEHNLPIRLDRDGVDGALDSGPQRKTRVHRAVPIEPDQPADRASVEKLEPARDDRFAIGLHCDRSQLGVGCGGERWMKVRIEAGRWAGLGQRRDREPCRP